jgi:hypothetical protein
MALFKRRSEPAPGWSPFDSDGEWGAFADAVRADARRRGWTVADDTSEVTDDDTRYGLGNLAQMCRAADRSEWPATVKAHFDKMAALPAETDFQTPEQARAVMKARLVDDGFLADVPWEVAARRVAGDLQLVLAYDLPDTVLIPRREEALAWGEEDELFAHALGQARAEPGIQLDRFEIDGAPVSVLSGESFFTATHALWADELDPPPSEHGTLLVVPTRNVVLAYAIRDAEGIGMIDPMLQFAARYFREGPGSLSDSVYWLRDGELERLNAWIDEKGPHVAPSDAFAELLGRLS